MIYYSDSMELEVISELFRGSVNDAVVCRDRRSVSGATYTMLVIRDRGCARKMLQVMSASERSGESPCLKQIAQNEELIFLFPYREERKFSTFAKGQLTSPAIGEEISINLVMECLSISLPWPILHLILQQDSVQISKERSIYFTYALDLSSLNPQKGEKNCVAACTNLILDLLGTAPVGKKKKSNKLKSFELIQKKNLNHTYQTFTELYQDIKFSALPPKKTSVSGKIRGVWNRNIDKLFRALLIICSLVFVAALAALITQIIFGDIPWLRLLQHTFDIIGTENLHTGGHV